MPFCNHFDSGYVDDITYSLYEILKVNWYYLTLKLKDESGRVATYNMNDVTSWYSVVINEKEYMLPFAHVVAKRLNNFVVFDAGKDEEQQKYQFQNEKKDYYKSFTLPVGGLKNITFKGYNEACGGHGVSSIEIQPYNFDISVPSGVNELLIINNAFQELTYEYCNGNC